MLIDENNDAVQHRTAEHHEFLFGALHSRAANLQVANLPLVASITNYSTARRICDCLFG
jgi:hypothetical protein